jgi:uncharacterized protein
MAQCAEQKLFIEGPVGQLEAIWSPTDSNTTRAAVICHPHPLHGGTMANKVVTTLARSWRDVGVSTLRFNFRGTGASAGVHDHGLGESDDLLATLAWLQQQGVSELDLAGFSFGSWVAASTAPRVPAVFTLGRLVLIAPPVQYEGYAALQPPPGTLVFQGDADDVVDPAGVQAWVASRQSPPELFCFSGAGHFFHGRLTELKDMLAGKL